MWFPRLLDLFRLFFENQMRYLERGWVHFLYSNISFLFFFQVNMLIALLFTTFYFHLFFRRNLNSGLVYLLYSAIYVNLVFFSKVYRESASFYHIFLFEIISFLSSYTEISKKLKSYQSSSNNSKKGCHQFYRRLKSCRLWIKLVDQDHTETQK